MARKVFGNSDPGAYPLEQVSGEQADSTKRELENKSTEGAGAVCTVLPVQ